MDERGGYSEENTDSGAPPKHRDATKTSRHQNVTPPTKRRIRLSEAPQNSNGTMRQGAARWSPLDTERLIFRRPLESDRASAIEIHVDPATNRHHPVPESVTEESSAERFDIMLRHWDEHGFGVWAVAEITRPSDIIGFTGVTHRQVSGRDALNLYYRYRPSAWGRGFALEGAQLAVRQALTLLPGLPVTAYTTPDNQGSLKTAQRAGLQRTHELDVVHAQYTDVYLTLGW